MPAGSIAPPDPTAARRRWRSIVPVALVVVAGATLVGCGGDDVADKVSEKIAEAGSGDGSDVSIDSDTGQVEIETPDGTMSMGTNELPADWPSEIPMPDDYELSSAIQTGNEAERSFNIGGTIASGAGTFDEVAGRFIEDGWSEQQNGTSTFDDATSSNSTYDNGTWTVIFSTIEPADGSDATFSYTVVPSVVE